MSKPIVLKIKTIGLSIKNRLFTSSVVECHYFYKKSILNGQKMRGHSK